jgi:SAM-dependent methyltransferase
MDDGNMNTRSDGPPPETEHLTREQIIWAYRLLLDRDPESDKSIENAGAYGTVKKLVYAIVVSDEFGMRNPSLPIDRKYLPAGSPALDVDAKCDAVTSAAFLSRTARTWEILGQERPHWSVLSSDQFSPERIAGSQADFYLSGGNDVAELFATLARAGVDPAGYRTVFEFGCGIGRVTPHLARRFPRVIACDVSASHSRLAAATINAAGIENADIVRATMPDFGMTQPFDVWYCRIVLQHNPPPLIRMILERALKLLTPNGVAVFQVPTYASRYRFSVAEYLATVEEPGSIEMHVLPQREIFAIAQEAGCVPLQVAEDDSIGVPGWISNVFTFRKSDKPVRNK